MHPIRSIKTHLVLFGRRSLGLLIWSKLTGKRPLFSPSTPALRHPIFIRIGTTDRVVFEQIIVEQHYAFDLPFTPAVIIDAGGNIGLSAVWFANRFPQARIVSIEPEPANFAMLKRNTEPYGKIVPVMGALWHEQTTLSLGSGSRGEYSFHVKADKIGLDKVRAYTIPEIMAMVDATCVDILKVDIEGAELEVFSHSSAWIEKVRCVMVELHDDVKPGCGAAFDSATRGFTPQPGRGEIVFKLNPSLPD